MVNGETVVAASFTLFAKAETSAIMDTSTITVDRMIRSSIAKSIGVYTDESTPVSSHPSFSAVLQSSIKLEQPARSAIMLKENTFPVPELLFMELSKQGRYGTTLLLQRWIPVPRTYIHCIKTS